MTTNDDDYPQRTRLVHKGGAGPEPAESPDAPPAEPGDAAVDLDDVAEVAAAFAAAEAAAAAAEHERQERIAADPRARFASLVGMPANEVVRVRRKREGLWGQTIDGSELIVVPPERPDAEGRTGVLLWRRPSPRHSYAAPTYARRACSDASLCPHRPHAPSDQQLRTIADARAEAERREAEAAKAARKTEREGREPWAKGRAGTLYRELIARRDALEAELADVDPSVLASARVYDVRALDQLRALVVREANLLRDAWHVEHPPPPDPKDVRLRAAVVEWSGRILAMADQGMGPDRLRYEAAALKFELGLGSVLTGPFDLGLIRREHDGARRWLAHHGIELPSVASAA